MRAVILDIKSASFVLMTERTTPDGADNIKRGVLHGVSVQGAP